MLSNEMIIEAAKEVEEYVKLTRGYLHENPEISGQEFDTSAFLKKEVKALGLPIEEVSTTGFIATLKCKNPGKTLALRSDIDALKMPESETNTVGKKKYVSKRSEACHSCGHDGHMAMLLGTMKVLVKLKNYLSGTIIFCFEEGEEIGCGIDKMLTVLSKKNIDAIWGIHLTSFMKTGTVSVDPGPRMAGAALINMNIIGRGGHGSRPDLSINPLFGAANVLMSLSSAWVNRIDTFGNSWKTGFFGVITCYQASSGQLLCQNTYSFHLNYSMYKEKTQHFYFKLSFSTSPFFAGLLTLLPLPLEEFFGSTFFRVIEVFSHPAVFLVDFRNDTIG